MDLFLINQILIIITMILSLLNFLKEKFLRCLYQKKMIKELLTLKKQSAIFFRYFISFLIVSVITLFVFIAASSSGYPISRCIFQFQTSNYQGVESDLSGTCTVNYELKTSDHIIKIKDNCYLPYSTAFKTTVGSSLKKGT